MTQPESSNQKGPSKMSKLMSGDKAESPLARLPRLKSRPNFNPPASPSPESESVFSRFRFFPALWTVASVISLTVNIILIALLLVLYNLLGVSPIDVKQKATGVIGGLYNNFVLMQEAHITQTIPIDEEIPVKFDLNVSGSTNVVLSQDVKIEGARVTVETGGLNIVNALATIILPQNTRLPVNIENLVVPVDKTVPIKFGVDIDIPLKDSQLNAPFQGLQNVVKPYLCIIQPQAIKPNPDTSVAPVFVCQ